MKKVYLILAATVGMTLASCTTNDYVGDETNVTTAVDDGSIKFGFDVQNSTRADIYGGAAATLLGNNFYVTGTKGTEGENNPSESLVFDNYLVSYTANTAGTTESNTANWEYVGVTPGTGNWANWVKTGSYSAQTIKYWDYSTSQYDFLAFSTGTKKAVSKTNLSDSGEGQIGNDEIGVTAMKYGTGLASKAVAYTFYVPTLEAIRQVYVTDLVTVGNSNYGKEVTLRFKNLGSKVRVALYETIPGYSVKDVKFYQVDGGIETDFTSTSIAAQKSDNATLISADNHGLPTRGRIDVYFPNVGSLTIHKDAQDYNKVAGTVSPIDAGSVKYKGFGELSNFAAKEDKEETGTTAKYLGRTLPTATFAGESSANYYEVMFPVSSSAALTLRVDYTLVSTDGSEEEIKVYGAKAVVPSTYTKWEPNYAYTYIFKISDNTNGWTTATGATVDNQGLFPITFDAVVAEATDVDFEQTTVTTVATPSITTYQQGHTYQTNEYSRGTGKDIYVQVMDNSTVPATLVSTLSASNSLLYKLSDATATEAKVMDALQNRTTTLGASSVKGRNGLTLTKNTNIDATVTTIVNGVDDKPITITGGQAAKIPVASLSNGTYAFVYDYTSGTKTTVNEFQPITVTVGTTNVEGKKVITTTELGSVTTTTTDGEAVNNAYIYFSKTTNGTGTTTYSYVSVAGKTTLPAGLLKVKKNTLSDATGTAVANAIYFDTYISNNGKYAVKVIKIVA